MYIHCCKCICMYIPTHVHTTYAHIDKDTLTVPLYPQRCWQILFLLFISFTVILSNNFRAVLQFSPWKVVIGSIDRALNNPIYQCEWDPLGQSATWPPLSIGPILFIEKTVSLESSSPLIKSVSPRLHWAGISLKLNSLSKWYQWFLTFQSTPVMFQICSVYF